LQKCGSIVTAPSPLGEAVWPSCVWISLHRRRHMRRRPRALGTLHGLLDEHRRDISMSAQPPSYQISIDTSPPASAAEIAPRSCEISSTRTTTATMHYSLFAKLMENRMVEHIDVHVNDGMTTQEIAAVDDAREALNQLAKTWDHWKRVGNALKVGREFCIRVTNRPPTDTDYKLRFSRWLLYNGFRDEIISKWDRASLLELMDNLPAGEDWRKTLTEAQRNSWNNPLCLLQRWTESGGSTRV